MFSKQKSWLSALIPGMITVAVVFGPSKITVASKLGTEFGDSLIWIIVVAIFFMIVYTGMAARIGIASPLSLLTIIRNKWGKGAAIVIGVGIFLVTTSFQAGNSIGVGIAIAELTHTARLPWIIGISTIAICLLFFRKFYSILSNLMIVIVLLMLLSFLLTCIMSRPDPGEIIKGLCPSLPSGSGGLAIAFIASCFSLVGAFYQTYLVQQRARTLTEEQRSKLKDKSLTGMLLLGIMSGAVMICAASVLHPQGISIQSAADMGKALKPLFGASASQLFLLGLLGASFSSLIGNATVGGTLLADALGYGFDMNIPSVKICIALIIIIGSVIASCFGTVPLQLIVVAQSITVLVVPIIGGALLAVSNDTTIMGNLRNKPVINGAAILGLVLIIFLAIINVKIMFF